MSGMGTAPLVRVTALTAMFDPLSGTEYTMDWPSGDHQRVVRRGVQQAGRGTAIDWDQKKTRTLIEGGGGSETDLPSGDQETALRTSNSGANGRMFIPFASIR